MKNVIRVFLNYLTGSTYIGDDLSKHSRLYIDDTYFEQIVPINQSPVNQN